MALASSHLPYLEALVERRYVEPPDALEVGEDLKKKAGRCDKNVDFMRFYGD